MVQNGIDLSTAKIGVLGVTFKENCPDLRNTKVVDIVSELKEYNVNVDIIDPWCSSEEAQHEYGLSLIEQAKTGFYDAIVLAVGHNEFKVLGAEKIRAFGKQEHVLYDLKYVLDKESVDMRL